MNASRTPHGAAKCKGSARHPRGRGGTTGTRRKRRAIRRAGVHMARLRRVTGRGVALQLHVFQRGRFCRGTRTAPYRERRPPPKLAQRPPSERSSRQLAPRGLALRGVRLVHQHPKAAGNSEGDASAHENVARTAAGADDTCESCRSGLQIRAHHLDRVLGHVQQVFARGTACLRDSRSAGDLERAARLRAVCFSSSAATAMHGAASRL